MDIRFTFNRWPEMQLQMKANVVLFLLDIKVDYYYKLIIQ